MPRFGLPALALVLALLPANASAQSATAVAKTKGWYADYAAARAEAKRTGRPMFLVFRCEP